MGHFIDEPSQSVICTTIDKEPEQSRDKTRKTQINRTQSDRSKKNIHTKLAQMKNWTKERTA